MELTALVRKAVLGLSLGLALAGSSGGCADAVPSSAQNYAQDGGVDGRVGEQPEERYDGSVGYDSNVRNDGNMMYEDDIGKYADAPWPVSPDASPAADAPTADVPISPDAAPPCLQNLYSLDNDGDGYGSDAENGLFCAGQQPNNYVSLAGDCDDANALIHPGAAELCNGINDDCDEDTMDGGGEQAPYSTIQAGVCLDSRQSCLDGLWQDDFSEVLEYEATPEVSCDGLDNDCNLFIDDILARPSQECFDGIGECRRSGLEYKLCQGSNGWSQDYFNCDAVAAPPAEEIGWDGLDQDCDGEDYGCPYFVDGSYSGENGEIGSPTHPWNTIQEAINNADPDYCESILVLPGTYHENLTVNKRLTIKSQEGALSTIIEGEDIAATIRSDNVRLAIDGFTITGGYGIYSDNSPVFISHNIIRDSRYGIALWSWGGNKGRIYNNIIVGNEGGDNAGGITFSQNGTLTIENNVIVGNTANLWGGGIYLGSGVNALVQNNIMAFNSPQGIFNNNSSGSNLTNQYNCLFSNGVNYAGSAALGLGEIIADPLFVNFTDDGDWSNDDYHLQEGSPCRNAGNPAAEYSDADGSVNDIGAYGGPEGDW